MPAGSPHTRFRHNIKAEVLRLVRSGTFYMHKRDVEQVARDSGLDESEAGRWFFVLGGVVWAGWVIGLGVDDECPIYDHAEEPRTWYGVAFDVQWFQDQELAPSPITSSPT